MEKDSIDIEQLKPVVEAVIFASDEAISIDRLAAVIEDAERAEIREAVRALAEDYAERGSGIVIEEVAGGFRFRTAPDMAPWLRRLFKIGAQRISKAAMEALSIVAYKQPVTRGEVEAIRGVDSGGVLATLLEKRFVKIVGRKDAPGRPVVYATTKEFLETFDLKDLSCLPTLKDIQNMEEADEEASEGFEGIEGAEGAEGSEGAEGTAEGGEAREPAGDVGCSAALTAAEEGVIDEGFEDAGPVDRAEDPDAIGTEAVGGDEGGEPEEDDLDPDSSGEDYLEDDIDPDSSGEDCLEDDIDPDDPGEDYFEDDPEEDVEGDDLTDDLEDEDAAEDGPPATDDPADEDDTPRG